MERNPEFEKRVLEAIAELKARVDDVYRLVSCELYGVNGRAGLKQQMAVLWEERENARNLKRMVLGALFTALASLVVALIRWGIGV